MNLMAAIYRKVRRRPSSSSF